MNSASGTSYRPDVDGLRALAVLCVIGFHAFPKRLPGGYVGVDVFFVISGFLISGIILEGLQHGSLSYVQFYVRRIRRIFPALLVVLTVSLIVGWFALLPDDYKELGKEVAAGAAFSSNLLFWTESGYFDVSATAKPLLHLWSLGVEEQFYIAWPLLLALLYRRTRRVAGGVAALWLASFAINVVLVQRSPTSSFYLPVTRFWELLTGALLCSPLLIVRRPDTQQPPASRIAGNGLRLEGLGWLGLTLIVASLWLVDENTPFPGWWALLPVLGTACVVLSRGSWLNRAVLSSRILVFIGLISYPLYLWHWVALSFLHLRYDYGASVAPVPLRVLAIASSFLLAWATYIWVERPIRYGPRIGIIPVALLVLMAVAGLCGLVVDLSDGVDRRYPAEVRSLMEFNYAGERDIAETAYRADVCFLDRAQTFAEIRPECIDTSSAVEPLVVLWGDSHAASLYPGLKSMRDRQGGFRVAQFTSSLCPPILHKAFHRRPNCEVFNDQAFQRIAQLKPEVVMLMGHWRSYAAGNELDLAALQNTVTRLKTAGVSRVILVGCLPEWTMAQPRVSALLWREGHATVQRSKSYLLTSLAQVDSDIRAVALSSGAVFASPRGTLCDDTGCLLSTSSGAAAPLAWDTSHLTPSGSDYLVRRIAATVLGHPPSAINETAVP